MTDDVDIFLEHFGVKEDEEVDVFFEHFGVKGMHWGVRKGKDTAADKQTKREGKAKKYQDESKQLQSQINAIGAPRTVRQYNRIVKLQEQKRVADENAGRKLEGKLTRKQRNRLIGAGAVAGILAAYGTYDAIQSGNGQRMITKGRNFVEGRHGGTFKKSAELSNPDMSVTDIMDKVVPQVNPGYHTGKWGSKMNCRRATMTYEMRRRGYDVTATHTTNARGQNVVGLTNAIRPGQKARTGKPTLLTKIMRKDKGLMTDAAKYGGYGGTGRKVIEPGRIFSEISKEPDGARGELGMIWSGGRGGHSMAWERVKGETVIFDTQSGEKFSNPMALKKLSDNMQEAGITRLDNLPMNSDYLMRWMKDAH